MAPRWAAVLLGIAAGLAVYKDLLLVHLSTAVHEGGHAGANQGGVRESPTVASSGAPSPANTQRDGRGAALMSRLVRGRAMSVTVIVKLSVDPEAFERVSQERAGDFEAVAAEGRAAGAIHHGFVAGEDEIVIIDEWPSAEAFQAFFATQPVIAKLMEAAGVRSAPEIAVYRTLETVDKF